LDAITNVTQIYFLIKIKLGKMPIHPLNFGLVTKIPPKILYWPIYSLNFTQLPNQYYIYSIIDVLNNWSCKTHLEFKKQTQSHEIETQRRKKKNLGLTYKEEREREKKTSEP